MPETAVELTNLFEKLVVAHTTVYETKGDAPSKRSIGFDWFRIRVRVRGEG